MHIAGGAGGKTGPNLSRHNPLLKKLLMDLWMSKKEKIVTLK
jgi:hypothetical protein